MDIVVGGCADDEVEIAGVAASAAMSAAATIVVAIFDFGMATLSGRSVT